MMKLSLCVLAALCLAASALQQETQVANKTFLYRQASLYQLFWHVDQPTVYRPELYQKARTYSITDNLDKYSDKQAVRDFLDHLEHGMLPRGQVFSVMHPDLRHEATVLFRMFYSAIDFDTFYDTAVWARFHVNEQMYVYALSVATLHRPDTKYIKLPPLYEVLPHFFFNEDVMHKAYRIAMGDVDRMTTMKKSYGGVDHHVIPANYSGWYLTRHAEHDHKMNYYTEDVGLNSYYFLASHDFPFWMSSTEYNFPKNIRGEFYFFVHKQLMARHYLERLSNDLGEVEYVSLDKPITTGYYPTMHFHNGLPFPQRETNAVVPLSMQKYVQMLKDLHARISNTVDLGYTENMYGKRVDIYGPDGVNVLGNIVQGNADSVNKRYYGQLDLLARKIFGFGLEENSKYQVVPSALEVFCTSLRDPMFYSLYKNVLNYYLRYKEHVKKYTHEDLLFQGVRVESLNVDKLQTYFEYFESMLNNGVSVRSHKEAQSTLIKARQYRLNHKPFTYHLTVTSDKNTVGLVRVFMGPKYNVHGQEIDIEQNYMNFVQLDQWIVYLKVGTNKVDRDSHESTFLAPDDVPSDSFYKLIKKSMEDGENYSHTTQIYGFPDRLVLPKGKKEGMEFKLFVMVSPLEDDKKYYLDSLIWGNFVTDARALGYPLDRPVNSTHFNVPNMYFKDVVIYHKGHVELNFNG